MTIRGFHITWMEAAAVAALGAAILWAIKKGMGAKVV